ncbi:MAG: HlyD family efflux transporter periplasmic adaptor subunit [Planctomycetota bacterium]
MNVVGGRRPESAELLLEVRFSPWIRRSAWVLLVLLVVGLLSALLAPWTQNVAGAGQVAAFTPLDRPQSVQAPVKGRVHAVHVTEGQLVAKDELLLELVDIDPEKLSRLQQKLEATRGELQATHAQVETLRNQIGILESARDFAISGARARVDLAREKLRSAEQKLIALRAAQSYAEQEVGRLRPLVPEFVEELRLLKAQAELEKASAGVTAGAADVELERAAQQAALADRSRIEEDANARVVEARARQQAADAKAHDLQAKLADIEGDLRQQRAQDVRAPRPGRVFRLAVTTDGSIVKEGDLLLQIVPVTARPAVELWVRGVDAPLVEPGRRVRLQFEGWPAVQFVGWPAVAVGTFGGEVALVDPTDSGQGRFRLLVVPDTADRPWPSERWLRQGVRAKGWVLLDEVPIWYELWRQLNGFPPVVALAEPDSGAATTERGGK